MIGPKFVNIGIVLVCFALVAVLSMPVEFVISAIIFTMVVRGALNLLRLAQSKNGKFEEFDQP